MLIKVMAWLLVLAAAFFAIVGAAPFGGGAFFPIISLPAAAFFAWRGSVVAPLLVVVWRGQASVSRSSRAKRSLTGGVACMAGAVGCGAGCGAVSVRALAAAALVELHVRAVDGVGDGFGGAADGAAA